ncbi:hypothetical protein ACFOKI_15985 [Sphingomonas qilianensis]|uniref:Uncharacterized protein n=1 Tax=Sphingomonas qilianensis TaxID=1736690 RepID=A0ABU9XWI4_9SPHN
MAASAVALTVFASADVVAQDYAARDVSGWTVAASNDKQGCFLTRVYKRAGDTTLLLGVDIDSTNRLSVLNANWSIKPKDRLSLDFRLSNGGFAKHAAIGIAADGKRGFVTSFEAKFPSHFAASKYLHISRDDIPVEQLKLDGSGAAVAELRRCVAGLRATPAATASDKERPGHIPKDPFATEAKRKSRK